MPKPPAPRERRRSRKRVLFDYMARWHEPGLGLDLGEWMHLHALGYGKWLARGQLTDTMTLALIAYKLADLKDDVINVAPTWGERFTLLTEALAHRESFSGRLPPDEATCLSRLRQLRNQHASYGGDHLVAYTAQGQAHYEPPPSPVIDGYLRIKMAFPALMKELEDGLAELYGSTEEIEFGRYAPIIYIGQRNSAFSKLAALRADLGRKYLDPNSTLAYRKACVRKWKQAALARAVRDEDSHRLLLEHNRRAREAHREGGRPPANAGAFLIV
jgi:hypothetical protein